MVDGNLKSLEPGCYEDDKFGVRIENLAFVIRNELLSKKNKLWYTLHPVTLCPIDTTLVDKRLMSKEHIDWLNAYHTRVDRELSQGLNKEHRAWLKKATRKI